MSGTLSDLDLLEAARNGDSRACEQVLEENNGLIWSVVRRYYGRGVEPDDLVCWLTDRFRERERGVSRREKGSGKSEETRMMRAEKYSLSAFAWE